MLRPSMLRFQLRFPPFVPAVAVLAVGILATGCETGSTHENMTTAGVSGQNVGQSSNKSGPVPGSTTGTQVSANAEQQPAAPNAPASNAPATK